MKKKVDFCTSERICHIFGAGSFYGLIAAPKAGDLVIAADGGLSYLHRLSLSPDLVVGDLDSMEPPACGAAGGNAGNGRNADAYQKNAAETAEHPAKEPASNQKMPRTEGPAGKTAPLFVRLSKTKDRSDSAAAIRLGIERGYRLFYLYGCTGGRLDHTLASIQDLAYLAEHGMQGYLFDDGMAVTAVSAVRKKLPAADGGAESLAEAASKSGDRTAEAVKKAAAGVQAQTAAEKQSETETSLLEFPDTMRGMISVFSHSDRCVLREAGFKYTVADMELTNTFPLGLSNEFTTLAGSISVKRGTVVITFELKM